jgi:hypothetical protein
MDVLLNIINLDESLLVSEITRYQKQYVCIESSFTAEPDVVNYDEIILAVDLIVPKRHV